MEGAGSTRRRFFQQGAGVAAGAFVGAAGLAVPKARARGGGNDLDAYVGELRLFAGNYVPTGWLACRGGELDREHYDELADEIGDNFGRSPYGGVELPDLRGRALLGKKTPSGQGGRPIGTTGKALCVGDSGSNPATFGLTYMISPRLQVGRQLFGEVRPFPYNFVPKNWMVCDGTVLKVSQFTGLFSVILDRFGGDGRNTFALPDLRRFTPVGAGSAPRLEPTPLGSETRGLAPARDPRPPRLHMIHAIATTGDYPSRDR
jgi:microcystin-dependent protein